MNPSTQKVQITITRNDGNWLVKLIFLDSCSIVDARNWKCRKELVRMEMVSISSKPMDVSASQSSFSRSAVRNDGFTRIIDLSAFIGAPSFWSKFKNLL